MPASANQPRRPGRPPNSDGAETRRQLLLSAVKRLSNVGYERMTLEDVAADAGITRAAIYRYFPSKQDLARAAVIEHSADIEDVDKHFAMLSMHASDLADELRAFILACLRSAADHPGPSMGYYAIAALAAQDKEIAELFRLRSHYVRDRVEILLDAALERGELPATTDKASIVDAISGLVYALGQGVASAPNQRVRDQIEASVGLMLRVPPWQAVNRRKRRTP